MKLSFAALAVAAALLLAVLVPHVALGTGTGPALSFPVSIAVEASGDLVVLDFGLDAVLRVDPVTGDRTIVSDDAGTGAGPAFSLPTDIAVEASGDLVVTDGDFDAVFRVDPVTGDRVILSGSKALPPTNTPTPPGMNTPTPPGGPTDTPTPTKQPDGDTDADGCTDTQENGPDETLGGRRDYLNFWDFFDPNRDRAVGFLDFLAVLRHFNTAGDPSTLDPDGPEPLLGEYWASADRGGQAPGGDPWDELPANGSITFADFLSVLRQFGHTCA